MHIFFSLDDYYVPYFSVMLASIMAHAKQEISYEIHVLTEKLTKENEGILRKQIRRDNRFRISFVNVTKQLKGQVFYTESRKDLNQSIYYRLLIPYLCPELERAVYLDGDMVALKDIAELEQVSLGKKLLAAVRDYQGIANAYCGETDEGRYVREELGLAEPDDLIISGLLILNLKEFRARWSLEEMIFLAGSRNWRHHDQDILNVLSDGNKQILDAKWNILPDIGIYHNMPERLYREWKTAAKRPFIVHFGGERKPWKYPNIPYSGLFWKYARRSPFYKRIIERRKQDFMQNKEFRKIYLEQTVLPYGSRRRALMRSLWRSIKLLK